MLEKQELYIFSKIHLNTLFHNLPSSESLNDNISKYRARMAMSSHIRCCSRVGVGVVHVFSMNYEQNVADNRHLTGLLTLVDSKSDSNSKKLQ